MVLALTLSVASFNRASAEPDLTFYLQPQSTTTLLPYGATFVAWAIGVEPISYQWQRNVDGIFVDIDSPIPGFLPIQSTSSEDNQSEIAVSSPRGGKPGDK